MHVLAIQLLLGDIQGGTEPRLDSRRADERGDRAEGFHRLCHNRLLIGLAVEFAGLKDGDHIASAIAGVQPLGRLSALLRVTAGDDHPSAARGELFHDGFAHAFGGTGDYRHLAGETEKTGRHFQIPTLQRICSVRRPAQAKSALTLSLSKARQDFGLRKSRIPPPDRGHRISGGAEAPTTQEIYRLPFGRSEACQKPHLHLVLFAQGLALNYLLSGLTWSRCRTPRGRRNKWRARCLPPRSPTSL